MNNNENKILKAAQFYFSDLAVTPIPVHPKTKKPVGDEWNKQKPKFEDLPQLFNTSELNIGVLLGEEYNLVSIDFDADKKTGKLTQEGFALLKKLVEQFPNTWLIQTGGGGTQMFFRPIPDRPVQRRIKILPGVDLLGNGVAIVAPSVHSNGNEYKNVVLPKSKDEIAIFPYELFDEMLSSSQGQPNLNGKDYDEVFYEGERDNALARYAGKIIGEHPENDWKSICLPLIRDYNRQRCIPPLPDKEAEKVFRSICKTHKRNQKMEANNMSKDINKQEEVKIDTSQFKSMATDEVIDILGLTIKKDAENKLITFLCELSAYTEDSQLNISFNAPSSTGKSYIPTEIAQLFPQEDVIEVGYCSPTAFFHDRGQLNKDTNEIVMDLSRKILIFLDQPHQKLLEYLRPLLSKDKKELRIKITDKKQVAGLKTKNIVLIGFPSVIFCTAGLNIDEQESTRFILLSPETSAEKIRGAIDQKIKKECNPESYKSWLEEVPERKLLKERILAIKQENIKEIKISSEEKVKEIFYNQNDFLKPRHQRDIGRITSLIKAMALLNLWFRKREGSTIIADDADIEEAFRIWSQVSKSQDLNLPPFVYNIYSEVILPAYEEKNKIVSGNGLSRKEIMQKHLKVYGRTLPDWQLRQQVLPMLETSGLISQEQDPNNKRQILTFPVVNTKEYSELDGGVNGNQLSTELEFPRGLV